MFMQCAHPCRFCINSLLKFQSSIGGQEITVQTDDSAIVKWYKEDLCTFPGPLGRRGWWHEFLSRFNLMIEYTPGLENQVGEALSRWAHPAGTAQDTNFYGSDQDLVGWEEDKRKERDCIRNELKKTYPEAFTAINAIHGCDAKTVEANLHQIRPSQKFSAVTPSGRLVDSMEELFLDTLTQTGRRQNSQAITSSVMRSVSKVDLTELYDAFEMMTWHTPGTFKYACSVNNIKGVKVPPDCAVLTADWTEHYQADEVFCPYWDRLVK